MITPQVYQTLLVKWYNKFKGGVSLEKRKLFKLSVIVHTMSKAAYDQNIFYTSDTDLTLVFELIEKEYKYDRAEILLYNETDKSFVTRDINKVDDSFVYQIESDIIQHHGAWVGQLQLGKNGEIYTSKPFQFTIENDLSTVSPPTLTDVNNWSNLKNSANELIAEMQTVISENETAALAYQQAENVRSDNEKQRVISESTRENHETTRQNQERDRERNEVERKSNEVTRVENETVRKQFEGQRQTYEQERQSAESIRVENENQRKIDHEGRSTELEDKADKVVIKNFIENGDFRNGLSGWSSLPSSISISIENEMLKATYTSVANNTYVIAPSHTYITDNLYYARTTVIPQMDIDDIRHYYSGVYHQPFLLNPTPNVENVLSNTFKGVLGGSSVNQIRLLDTNSNVGDSVLIKDSMLMNLTQTFGEGNEPTREEMDEIIKVTGYFNSEYALNNKEMLICTLSLIRKNKNAIISLGGTI